MAAIFLRPSGAEIAGATEAKSDIAAERNCGGVLKAVEMYISRSNAPESEAK